MSWNSEGGFVFAPKISIGVVWKGKFVNLTFTAITGTSSTFKTIYGIESQFGRQADINDGPKTPLFWIGGVGIAIQSDSIDNHVYPRLSMFTGFLLFLTADVIVAEQAAYGFGLEGVLPLPLAKLDFRVGG